MSKICTCGTCETVAMRAVGILGKMIDDDECVVFTAALGYAITAIAGAVMHTNLTQRLEDKGIPTTLADAAAMAKAGEDLFKLEHQVLKHLQAPGVMDTVIDRLNVHIGKRITRMAEESNLPKGD